VGVDSGAPGVACKTFLTLRQAADTLRRTDLTERALKGARIAPMSPKKTSSVPVTRKAQQPEPEPALKTRLWPSVGLLPHVAVVFVLGAIVLFTYCNTLYNTGFALDNKFIILEDPRLREANQNNLHLIFTQDYWWPKAVSGLYRPLTTLSYLFNYSTLGNGAHAAGYHWINFILHWANSVFVYFAVLVLMERLWPAFFVAALFGTHPVATESVANIVGRADLFTTLWVLVGFLCYVKSTTAERKTKPERKPVLVAGAICAFLLAFVLVSWKHPTLLPASLQSGLAISLALVALGASTVALACLAGGWSKMLPLTILMLTTTVSVFCKESGVVVFGVIMLYDFLYRLRRNQPNWFVNLVSNFSGFALRGYVVLLAPILTMFYVRSQIFGQLRPPELPWVDNPLAMPSVGFWTARITAIKVIGRYFWLLLWPQQLSCDYSYNQIPIVNWHFNTWEDWKAVVALVSIVIVLLVAIRNYHRNKPLFFFVFFFFGTLLPSSNLIPNPTFGQSLFDKTSWCIGSIMAERFLYLPSIGFCGCAVIAVYSIGRRLIPNLDVSPWAQRIWLQVVARTALSLIVVAYGVRAFNRNDDWKDDETLWTKAVETCPNSFKTHKSLAFALYEKDPEGKNIDRIIEEGEKARQVTDKTQIVLLHLGAYYRIKGDTYAQHAADGVTLVPSAQSMPWYQKSVEALSNAVPLDKEFNVDNRQKELKRGRDPNSIPDIGNHEIYWNLGISYMRMSEYQKALDAYLYMRHLAPTNPDAYLSIASVYLSTGHAEEAGIALLQALLLDGSRTQALRLLADIYRQIDKEGCAVIMNQGEPRLNLDCAIVRTHICLAYYGLIRVFLETKDPELHQKAVEAEQNAEHNYRCSPDDFHKLLSDQPTTVSSTP
jgi:tetratricopeptide (TPR) repeat protein